MEVQVKTDCSIKDAIKEFIEDYMREEVKLVEKERNSIKNIPKAFMNVGGFGEELTTIIFPNSFGSASKGGCAFDNHEYENGVLKIAREVKTCCLIQPKMCNTCKKKAPYFQNICLFCNENNFAASPKDSRFGIDTDAHLKYAQYIKEYVTIIINHEHDTNQINLEVYLIKSDNVYFTNYIKNQAENSSSRTCNLLPYSYDFYASGPIKLIAMSYDMHATLILEDIDLSQCMALDFDTSVLTRAEKTNYEISDTRRFVPYDEIKHRLVLRKKNLNKSRGTTTRL